MQKMPVHVHETHAVRAFADPVRFPNLVVERFAAHAPTARQSIDQTAILRRIGRGLHVGDALRRQPRVPNIRASQKSIMSPWNSSAWSPSLPIRAPRRP